MSEGYGRTTSILMVQWEASGFFWLKLFPLRMKTGTWEMSEWLPTRFLVATFSGCHLPPTCHQAEGCQDHMVGSPCGSCWEFACKFCCLAQAFPPRSDSRLQRRDTGILYVSCEGAQCRGGRGGFGNSLHLCPATLHLVALDKLLDLFETWLSHLLMVPTSESSYRVTQGDAMKTQRSA